VPHDLEQDELNYLGREIYPGGNTACVNLTGVDAYDRFSVREA